MVTPNKEWSSTGRWVRGRGTRSYFGSPPALPDGWEGKEWVYGDDRGGTDYWHNGKDHNGRNAWSGTFRYKGKVTVSIDCLDDEVEKKWVCVVTSATDPHQALEGTELDAGSGAVAHECLVSALSQLSEMLGPVPTTDPPLDFDEDPALFADYDPKAGF